MRFAALAGFPLVETQRNQLSSANILIHGWKTSMAVLTIVLPLWSGPPSRRRWFSLPLAARLERRCASQDLAGQNHLLCVTTGSILITTRWSSRTSRTGKQTGDSFFDFTFPFVHTIPPFKVVAPAGPDTATTAARGGAITLSFNPAAYARF